MTRVLGSYKSLPLPGLSHSIYCSLPKLLDLERKSSTLGPVNLSTLKPLNCTYVVSGIVVIDEYGIP